MKVKRHRLFWFVIQDSFAIGLTLGEVKTPLRRNILRRAGLVFQIFMWKINTFFSVNAPVIYVPIIT